MSFSTDEAVNFYQVFDVVANHCENLERFGFIYQHNNLIKKAEINGEMLLKFLTRNKNLTSLQLPCLTDQACEAFREFGFVEDEYPFPSVGKHYTKEFNELRHTVNKTS